MANSIIWLTIYTLWQTALFDWKYKTSHKQHYLIDNMYLMANNINGLAIYTSWQTALFDWQYIPYSKQHYLTDSLQTALFV